MEQFSLEKYLENPNRKVVTRDGRDVRILCIDRKGNGFRNVVALVTIPTESGVYESINTYWEDGKESKSGCTSNDDLFFAPNKKEGWVNLYTGYLSNVYVVSKIFSTEEDAKKEKPVNYVATIKIEWEE